MLPRNENADFGNASKNSGSKTLLALTNLSTWERVRAHAASSLTVTSLWPGARVESHYPIRVHTGGDNKLVFRVITLLALITLITKTLITVITFITLITLIGGRCCTRLCAHRDLRPALTRGPCRKRAVGPSFRRAQLRPTQPE